MSSSHAISSGQILDQSSSAGVPPLLGFCFSFRLALPVLLIRIFGIDPQTSAEIKLLLGVMLLGLVCFCSLGNTHLPLRSMLRVTSVRWVIVFLVFSGCSLMWSSTASPSASFAYWCGTVCDVVSIILLLRAASVEEVTHRLMKGFIWGACCIAVVAWAMPAQYDLRLGDEDFFNTNSIGNICAVAILFTQYLNRCKDGNWQLVAPFLGVTLVRSLSKTTIVAFLLCEIFLVIQDRSMARKTKIFLTITATLVVLMFWGLLESYYDVYTTAGNQAETLTGRTAIWSYSLESGLEQPWFGHGFDSMWKVVPAFGTFEARHAENELLEQFYSYGVAGICILAGLYGSLYRQIRKISGSPQQIILLSILFYVVVRGFAEAEPFDLLLPLWASVMLSLSMEQIRLANLKVSQLHREFDESLSLGSRSCSLR